MTDRAREFPPRPLVPVLSGAVIGFLCAAMLLLGNLASAMLSDRGVSWAPAVLMAAVGSIGCVLGHRLSKRFSLGRWTVALSAGFLLGCLSSCLWSVAAVREYRALDGVSASGLTFRISSDPTISDGSYSYHADAYREGKRVGSVRLAMDRDFEQDSIVQVVGRISRFEDDDGGRARFFKREMRRVKVVKVLKAEKYATNPLTVFRNHMVALLSSLNSEAGALVAGVVCGRSSELKAGDAADWFSRTGTSHLIAVSGSHLALVCFLTEDFATRIGVSRRSRFAAMALVGLGYTLFTGASASAVRSFCMVASGLVVVLSGRRRHSISALMCTIFILCMMNPAIVFDLGFQLSCASVLGILLFAPYLSFAFSVLHVPDIIASPLALTLCAQLMTYPLTVPVFGSISLIAPLANLVVGPVVSVLLMLGVIVVPIYAVIPLAMPLAQVPLAAARCVLFFEQLFSSVPYASMALSITGPSLYLPWILLAILYVLWPRPHSRIVLAVAVIGVVSFVLPVIYWDRFAPPSVTVLDVGQADAILVRQGAATLLVDSGVDARVVEALARQNVHHLDAVLITHWDEDHWGGLPSVLEEIPVGRLLVARGAEPFEPDDIARSGVSVSELEHGDELSCGDFHAKVVWPQEDVDGLDNADSLCLRLDYRADGRSLSILLTGDSEVDQEHAYAPEVGDIDVLKVGHHGSKVSVDEELLAQIDPEICIASAGEGNRYGHPSLECRKAVRNYGSTFLCTIDNGDIRLEPGEIGARVSLQKGSFGSSTDRVP